MNVIDESLIGFSSKPQTTIAFRDGSLLTTQLVCFGGHDEIIRVRELSLATTLVPGAQRMGSPAPARGRWDKTIKDSKHLFLQP